MTKPDWKTKPHERVRMTLQQENEQLKKRIEMLAVERDEYRQQATHFREDRDKLALSKDRYAVLRTKDVMVLDGEPKYLKGEDLDKYCDEENSKFWGVGLGMSNYLQQIAKQINGGQNVTKKLIINASQMAIAKKLFEKEQHGNDTGSKSKEADSKDSGHHTDVLRYADWYGLWKQRRT
jgi:hypothetical protein